MPWIGYQLTCSECRFIVWGISAGFMPQDMIAAKGRIAELIGCSIFGLAGSGASIVASMPKETGRTASERTRLIPYTLHCSPSPN